jgi:hypothetical protein
MNKRVGYTVNTLQYIIVFHQSVFTGKEMKSVSEISTIKEILFMSNSSKVRLLQNRVQLNKIDERCNTDRVP